MIVNFHSTDHHNRIQRVNPFIYLKDLTIRWTHCRCRFVERYAITRKFRQLAVSCCNCSYYIKECGVGDTIVIHERAKKMEYNLLYFHRASAIMPISDTVRVVHISRQYISRLRREGVYNYVSLFFFLNKFKYLSRHFFHL